MTLALAAYLLAGCSGYDPATGEYAGKGVSLTFPAGWSKTDTIPYATITVNDEGRDAQMSLIIQDLPDNITFDQYLKRVRAGQGSVGAHEKESGPISIDGRDGHWSIRTITVGGQPFTSITYSVMKDRKVFSVMGISGAGSFDKWVPSFDSVAETIALD